MPSWTLLHHFQHPSLNAYRIPLQDIQLFLIKVDNYMDKAISSYMKDDYLWERNSRSFDDPILRKSPYLLRSPYGKIHLRTKAISKINNRFKPGTLLRFRYKSVNEPFYEEHDPRPLVILLNNPGRKVFFRSRFNTKHKGSIMFHGLNLNYLKDEAMTLMIDALILQNITKGDLNYQSLMAAAKGILPRAIFRKYYVKGTNSRKIIKVWRDGGQE